MFARGYWVPGDKHDRRLGCFLTFVMQIRYSIWHGVRRKGRLWECPAFGLSQFLIRIVTPELSDQRLYCTSISALSCLIFYDRRQVHVYAAHQQLH
jgi:hypothetical protein